MTSTFVQSHLILARPKHVPNFTGTGPNFAGAGADLAFKSDEAIINILLTFNSIKKRSIRFKSLKHLTY
jgi:hypothetical protein